MSGFERVLTSFFVLLLWKSGCGKRPRWPLLSRLLEVGLFRAFSGLLSLFATFSGPGAFSKAISTFLDLGPFLDFWAFSEPFRASLLLRNPLAQPASFPLLTWLPALQEFEICSKKPQIGSLAECLSRGWA